MQGGKYPPRFSPARGVTFVCIVNRAPVFRYPLAGSPRVKR